VRSLVLTVGLLLVLASPAAAQEEIDRAAEALREDPVHVDPAAEDVLSANDADELRDRIREDLGEGRLFVAVLPELVSAGAETVATELGNRIAISGSIAVIVGNQFRLLGSTQEEADAGTAAFEAHQDDGAAAVLLDTVDRLAALQGAGEGGGGAEDDGGGIGAGGLVLLGLAGAGGVAFAISRRQRRRQEAEQFAEVKDNARDDLVALGEDIRALELDMDMPGVSGEARADYETAVGAYQRADQTWQLAQRPDDLEPVGAALEEGRWAMSSARARLEQREPPERRSPCFFDPRHGPSDREVEWAPDGGAPRMVPACEADAQRVERGDDPQAREVTVGGQRMPYWAAGPMYAPFMGGFFGAGILPGLMVGTMLGSAWDTPNVGGDIGGGDFGGGDFGGGDFGGGDF
jgi:hypothetical protein